jgi:predicted RNA-binding protein with PIN domain
MFHIVIDGYNLLHASRGMDHDWTHLELEEARTAIISFLATRRQPTRENITIVFDGAAELIVPRESRVHGIEIVFSEPGVNADEAIRILVATSPNPKSVLVVTADRQIKDAVLKVGAKVVSPVSFLQRAEEESEKRKKAPPREPREKYTGVDKGQVAMWRKIFGFDKGTVEDIEGGDEDKGKRK